MKTIKAMTGIFLFLCSMTCQADEIPEPYRSIKDLPFDDSGWFSNARTLGDCLKVKQPKIVIEIGSWLGLSARFIAQNISEDGKVYAVDTWKGSPEHRSDPRLPHLYQIFLSNIKQAGLTDKIIPIRMASLEAAEALNVVADLIYIDAGHDEESVYKDIIAWYPHLAAKGILCGDDWSWPSVSAGVKRAAKELNLKITAETYFWELTPLQRRGE